MKPIHIVALLGGAGALVYLATRGKKAFAAPFPTSTATDRFGSPISHSSGAFVLKRDPSGASQCFTAAGAKTNLAFCTDPSSQLEGYFSTTALADAEFRTSYDHGHTHAVPCCSGCAQGRGCQG